MVNTPESGKKVNIPLRGLDCDPDVFWRLLNEAGKPGTNLELNKEQVAAFREREPEAYNKVIDRLRENAWTDEHLRQMGVL